jgi:hypothetical protein
MDERKRIFVATQKLQQNFPVNAVTLFLDRYSDFQQLYMCSRGASCQQQAESDL